MKQIGKKNVLRTFWTSVQKSLDIDKIDFMCEKRFRKGF